MTIYSLPKYCTYLTIYSGNLLPPFYIGSTSVEKIRNGYHGSVCSKKYVSIWKQELNDNPHLFRTIILERFYSRKNATYNEYLLHIKFDVVKSNQFVNQIIANKKFGEHIYGDDNPMKNKLTIQKMLETRGKNVLLGLCKSPINKKHSLLKTKERMLINNPMKEESTIQKMTKSRKLNNDGKDPTLGTIWIANKEQKIRKRIKPEELEIYIKDPNWIKLSNRSKIPD